MSEKFERKYTEYANKIRDFANFFEDNDLSNFSINEVATMWAEAYADRNDVDWNDTYSLAELLEMAKNNPSLSNYAIEQATVAQIKKDDILDNDLENIIGLIAFKQLAVLNAQKAVTDEQEQKVKELLDNFDENSTIDEIRVAVCDAIKNTKRIRNDK